MYTHFTQAFKKERFILGRDEIRNNLGIPDQCVFPTTRMFYINDEIDGDDNTIMIQVGVT